MHFAHEDSYDMAPESSQSSSNGASHESSLSSVSNDECETSAMKKVVSSDLKVRKDKIKIESSVRSALEMNKSPLLSYFKKCSPEEYRQNLARDHQIEEDIAASLAHHQNAMTRQRLLEKRELDRNRQRRGRERKWEKEMVEGIRGADGRKRKIVPMEISDPGPSKKQKLAEETRPARVLKRNIKNKTRKPQGRKEKHRSRDAKNHNWFTPICWRIIEEAAKMAGWQMSATKIVKVAKARNPEVFEKLSHETVRDWIDWSGDKSRWSDAALRKIEAANAPGHQNGGPVGVLVCSIPTMVVDITDLLSSGTSPCCHQEDPRSIVRTSREQCAIVVDHGSWCDGRHNNSRTASHHGTCLQRRLNISCIGQFCQKLVTQCHGLEPSQRHSCCPQAAG